MIDDSSLLHLPLASAIVAVAYLIRGITGFGSGLVAIPLLAMLLPLPVVVPVVALLDFMASLAHGIGNRRIIQWQEILTLLPFSIVGIVTAIYLLKTVDADALRKALGVFVIAYALYSLVTRESLRKVSRLWAVPWGGIGGMINAMFGTGGPFYVIYLKLRNLDKPQLRATIAAILLLDGVGRLIGYTSAGFFTLTTLSLAAAGIPLGGLALYVGGSIHTGMSPRFFQIAISSLLLISGAALLIK